MSLPTTTLIWSQSKGKKYIYIVALMQQYFFGYVVSAIADTTCCLLIQYSVMLFQQLLIQHNRILYEKIEK